MATVIQKTCKVTAVDIEAKKLNKQFENTQRINFESLDGKVSVAMDVHSGLIEIEEKQHFEVAILNVLDTGSYDFFDYITSGIAYNVDEDKKYVYFTIIHINKFV